MPAWLPDLICLPDYGGDWNRYHQAIYEAFCQDFIQSQPQFMGRRLGLKRHPLMDGKEATFWHFVSEGAVEANRLPDLRRCERIRWPRAVIERADDPAVKVWSNQRGHEKRVCLWLDSEDYLVVLADRETYLLPWTAYLVREEHRKRKLLKGSTPLSPPHKG